MLTFVLTAAVSLLVVDRVIIRTEPVQVVPDASEPYVLMSTWDRGLSGMAVSHESSSNANCEAGAEAHRSHIAALKDSSQDRLPPRAEIFWTCIPK